MTEKCNESQYYEGSTIKLSPIRISGSKYILFSTEFQKYLSYKAGDKIVIKCDKGKHGRFISYWVEKKEAEKKKGDSGEKP